MRSSVIILIQLCILLLCIQKPVNAQEKLDSLRSLFRIENDDSIKCSILNQMLPMMRMAGSIDSAIHYGHQMRTLAKSSDINYYEMRASVANGLTYATIGLTDSVIFNYKRAIAVSRPGVDDFLKASVLNSLGVTFFENDLYDSSYHYYLRTIALLEELNQPRYVARTKNNIGNIFWQRKDYRKALKYYKEALADTRKLNDSLGMPSTLTNIANSYNKFGERDSALLAMNEAIALYRNQENKKGEALALGDIVFIYNEKGEYDKALVAANRSIALNQETNSDRQMAHSYLSLGAIHTHMRNYDKAIEAYNKGLDVTNRLDLKSIGFSLHKHLVNVYKIKGNYERALTHSERMIMLSDSIFTSDKNELIAKYEARYESEKKSRELTLLQKNQELQESELRRKTLQQNALIGTGALIAVAGTALFFVYRSRQEQKQTLLDRQLAYERMEAGRLQELDEARSRFFVNIAHEFRTPLTLIQVPAEQIHEESKETDSKENAHLILANASRLLSMTNQLLDLTKLEAGMVKLQPVRRDLIAFAKGCVFSFESLADEKDITLSFEANEDVLEMDFDPEKCATILNNLVSNALKFTQPFGNVTVNVNHNSLRPSMTSISVSDSGIGIDAQSLPKIFDRFYQVKDSNMSYGGTGIGLAFVKELVELHGGEIEVASKPGEGTTFSLTLPRLQPGTVEPVNAAISETASPAYDQSSDEPSMARTPKLEHENTVLVVEDNNEVRNFIAGMLRQYYHVLEAEHGKQGLVIAGEHIPDLIISDVMMPEMDGYEFCREIKKDFRTSHIPVILLTAKGGTDDKVESLELGADEFLSKPFHRKELLARMNNLIRIRRQLQLKYNGSNDRIIHPVKESKFIVTLKRITEQNIENANFSVDDLSREAGMSRTQIHRKLKALTGQSTTQFVREYKLGKALTLLESGGQNVSEVAFTLGFSSLAYFSTAFTQHYGYAPSQVGKNRR